MVSKKFRLPIIDFSRTYSRIANSYFVLKLTPNYLGYNRIGIIIGLKIEKSSARRHLIKRRIFGILKSWPNLKIDILVIPSPKIKEIKKPLLLSNEFDAILKKVLLRKNI